MSTACSPIIEEKLYKVLPVNPVIRLRMAEKRADRLECAFFYKTALCRGMQNQGNQSPSPLVSCYLLRTALKFPAYPDTSAENTLFPV